MAFIGASHLLSRDSIASSERAWYGALRSTVSGWEEVSCNEKVEKLEIWRIVRPVESGGGSDMRTCIQEMIECERRGKSWRTQYGADDVEPEEKFTSRFSMIPGKRVPFWRPPSPHLSSLRLCCWIWFCDFLGKMVWPYFGESPRERSACQLSVSFPLALEVLDEDWSASRSRNAPIDLWSAWSRREPNRRLMERSHQ